MKRIATYLVIGYNDLVVQLIARLQRMGYRVVSVVRTEQDRYHLLYRLIKEGGSLLDHADSYVALLDDMEQINALKGSFNEQNLEFDGIAYVEFAPAFVTHSAIGNIRDTLTILLKQTAPFCVATTEDPLSHLDMIYAGSQEGFSEDVLLERVIQGLFTLMPTPTVHDIHTRRGHTLK